MQNTFNNTVLRAQNLYYGMNVQNLANRLGAFLKLYHESLQALV